MRWRSVARQLRATTYSGPLVSPATARAGVLRLRAGVEWAGRRLGSHAPQSDEVDSQVLVALKDAPIVDCVAAAEAICRFNERVDKPVTFFAVMQARYHATKAPSLVLGDRLYLNAPAFLQAVTSRRLDARDYARWLGLEAGIRLNLRKSTRVMVPPSEVLEDLIVEKAMQQVSPRDIASAEWIRRHAPVVSHSEGNTEATREFLTIALAAQKSITIVLTNPPSEEELAAPTLWIERVG